VAIISREDYKALSKITESSLDTLIDLLIPAVEEDYLSVRGIPFTEEEDRSLVYPAGSTITAKLMLDWLLSPESGKALGGGIQTESIGKYSYALAEIDTASGYPKALIGRIASFVRGR